MKKFFLILLINAPFLLNNTIKADTSQLFTLFDIRKENNVDNVSKLFLDMGFPAKEFYSGYDNTNFFNISFEQEDCHILLNYTPSNRYIFRYQVYKDSLNKNDFLDGPRQVLETLIKKYGLPDYAGIPYETDVKYGINEYELKDLISNNEQTLDTSSLHLFVNSIYYPESFQYVWKKGDQDISFRCLNKDFILNSHGRFLYIITNENLKNVYYAERKEIEEHNKLMDSLKTLFWVMFAILAIAILGYFWGKQIKKEQIQLKLQKEEKTKRKVISKEQYTQYVNELCDKYGAITRSIVYRQSCYGEDNIKYYQDILVFQKPKMIVFGNKEYHFENILSCSMYDENQNNTHISQVTKTKTGSMLGRAAVGALTFGVAGAIVGAVTAKKESASTITPTHSGSYIVKIGIKSVKEPTVTLDFGNDKSKAEEVHALMQAIIAMK